MEQVNTPEKLSYASTRPRRRITFRTMVLAFGCALFAASAVLWMWSFCSSDEIILKRRLPSYFRNQEDVDAFVFPYPPVCVDKVDVSRGSFVFDEYPTLDGFGGDRRRFYHASQPVGTGTSPGPFHFSAEWSVPQPIWTLDATGNAVQTGTTTMRIIRPHLAFPLWVPVVVFGLAPCLWVLSVARRRFR